MSLYATKKDRAAKVMTAMSAVESAEKLLKSMRVGFIVESLAWSLDLPPITKDLLRSRINARADKETLDLLDKAVVKLRPLDGGEE